jgi:acyl-CoA synthetase (AMP-forming)/AMP-acid ligase II
MSAGDPDPAARAIRPTMPVPAERADRYRAAQLWDDRRLADGIESAAARNPDAFAVADNDRRLTWRELSQRVNAGVAAFAAAGLRPGAGVVLVSGNSAEGVVAYHAILRTGAICIALDRRCGAGDLRHALDVAGPDAAVVLPGRESARLLEGLAGIRSIALEALAQAPATASGERAAPEPDRDAPAVVLFTSGTTSRPKAVIHSLNTLTAGARNMARVTGADANAIAFLVSPLTSISGIMQMHLVADQHAALVLEDRFDAEAALDRINAHRATLLGGAPVIAERLLRAAAARADRRIALRTLALGGAMLPRPLLELATDIFGIAVARVYGSSEAPNTTGSLPEDDRAKRLLDDGALLPGSELRVGSREHAQEGLLRGPAVFLGYVDPGDNAAAFEDGWYRTGDAVELAADRLTVVGRLKDVVNRNGLKISLAEVDGALARLPGAIEYACFGVPDEATGERLAVAIRADPGCEIALEAVTAHLQSAGLAVRKLPEQLVIWQEPLPRTASGKIIRNRLVMESAGKPSLFAARLGDALTRHP